MARVTAPAASWPVVLDCIQYSTARAQAHRSSLKCHHSRVASLPVPIALYTLDFLHLPGTSSMFHPTRSHRAGTANHYSPRLCTRLDHTVTSSPLPSQAAISKSSHWFLPECLLSCLLALPRLVATTQVEEGAWVLPSHSSQGVWLPASRSRAHPCPSRSLLPPLLVPSLHFISTPFRLLPARFL